MGELMHRQTAAVLAALLLTGAWLYAEPPQSPHGADAVPDLYAPNLAGPGGFTTTTGGAPASALNPAQGGSGRQMIFDAGYLAIPAFCTCDEQYGQAAELGALFPTKSGAFGGSIRYIDGFNDNQCTCLANCQDSFAIGPTYGGNIFAAREIYPGMSLGAGFNFGYGADLTLSADVGIHHNAGKLGFLDNVTWAIVLRSMGKSYFPTAFTLAGGVSFDFLHIKGRNDKPDPLVMGVAADVIVPSVFYPSYINVIFKAGIKMTITELITLSASWPGASGLNMRERKEETANLQVLPSIGLGVNIAKALKIDSAYRPLYGNGSAIGTGISRYVAVADKRPPRITLKYPQAVYFSPNHDGESDHLEVPVKITDNYYVVSWAMEIKDEEGNVIRTIESESMINNRFFPEKTRVEIPSAIRWDGTGDSGDTAQDGKYFFTITAADNSGNTAVSGVYEAAVDNTPPEISIEAMTDDEKIFNPAPSKGSVLKDTITFIPIGSAEEAWKSGIWNSAGVQIRSFAAESGVPSPRVWDGRNNAGKIVPDGIYTYRIGATDRAHNSASAAMNNIIVDTRTPSARLTSSVSLIVLKPDDDTRHVDFAIRLLLDDGVYNWKIDNWKLELFDETGAVHRTFSGGAEVPSSVRWNGLDEQGQIRKGEYTPRLTVTYTRGEVITAASAPVTVNIEYEEIHIPVSISMDVHVISNGEQLRIQTSPIFFRADHADFIGLSEEIVENNYRILWRVAQVLNQYSEYRVVVEGHTNYTQPPGPRRNRERPELQRLSEDRAKAVVGILIRNDVDPSRLSYYGVGASRPVTAFEDRDNWWKNRRVEFILMK
jgi:outer membrane protein OmpA-like peptidoglycan-associated protein